MNFGVQIVFAGPGANDLLQFGAVGGDDGGAAVALVIGRFRIDDHRLAGEFRMPQHLDGGDELVEVDVEDPLAGSRRHGAHGSLAPLVHCESMPPMAPTRTQQVI